MKIDILAIKKNWKIIAIAILSLVCVFLYRAWTKTIDTYISSKIATEKIIQEKAESQKIADEYKIKNDELDREIDSLQSRLVNLNADIDVWRKKSISEKSQISKLATCPEKLTASLSLLDDCHEYVGNLKISYTKQIDDMDISWNRKISLKDSEIESWKKRDESHIADIGKMTNQIVRLKLKSKRVIAIGPYVGYGIGGKPSVGIGVMFTVFRFRTPMGI